MLQNSTEPEEFKELVMAIRNVELGIENRIDKDKKVESLSEMKDIFQKSIVAGRDLEINSTLSMEDLAFKKPGNLGISAADFETNPG